MKKLLIMVVTSVFVLLAFVQCNSKEEKALVLIKDYFSNNLEDCDSYNPIRTIVDSAYNSVVYDTTILRYADIYCYWKSKYVDLNYYKERYISDDSVAYERASKEADDCLNKVNVAKDSIRALYNRFEHYVLDGSDFFGWRVTHTYSCETKDGSLDSFTEDFIMDKNFNEILFTTADEKYNRNKRIIVDLTKDLEWIVNDSLRRLQHFSDIDRKFN